MDRRGFLKQTGTLIAGAAIAPYALSENGAQTESGKSGGRLVFPLNRNWRYHPRVVEGGHAKDFDDSAFERVVIPHTNFREPWHGFDEISTKPFSYFGEDGLKRFGVSVGCDRGLF